VADFDVDAVDPQACVANARRFDAAAFRAAFPREVEAALRAGPAERFEVWPRILRRPGHVRRPVAWRGGR
jgi:hypothetical protein